MPQKRTKSKATTGDDARTWTRAEIQRLIADAINAKFAEKRREMLSDVGTVVLEGKLQLIEFKGQVEARIDHTNVSEFLARYYEDGDVVKLVVIKNVEGP